MKAYTDLEQSEKLSEILPLESADMRYAPFGDTHPWVWDGEVRLLEKDSVPCWSLAALLSVLPNSIYDNTDEYSQIEFSKRSVAYHDMDDGIKVGSIQDNLIDACYKLILKLHELNLL